MTEHVDVDLDTGEIIADGAAPRMPAVQSPIMRPLASVETTQVCTALAKAQGEFDAPKRTKPAKISGTTRDGNRYEYSYKYAPLEEIISAVQKPMAAVGLSRQQYLVSRGNQWFVRTIIWHISGEWISSDYPVFPEAMTGPKFAAAVTYAKRQGLSLAVCLAPEDDLDVADAEPVSQPQTQGATRAARPPSPPVQPVATSPVTSAAAQSGSGMSSDTGDGSASPKQLQWITDFLASDSYEADPKKVGSWATFERIIVAAAAHAAAIDQVTKLRIDNENHLAAFAGAKPKDHARLLATLGSHEVRLRTAADAGKKESQNADGVSRQRGGKAADTHATAGAPAG